MKNWQKTQWSTKEYKITRIEERKGWFDKKVQIFIKPQENGE